MNKDQLVAFLYNSQPYNEEILIVCYILKMCICTYLLHACFSKGSFVLCQARKTSKHLNSNISYACCKKPAGSTLSKVC